MKIRVRRVVQIFVLILVGLSTPYQVAQLEEQVELRPILVEMERLRPLAAAAGHTIPTSEEILANYRLVQIPDRPTHDVPGWPQGLPAKLWDYTWGEGSGVTQRQLQALLYGRKDSSGVAIGNWTTDTYMPLIMVACDRSYLSPGYRFGMETSLEAIGWQPGESIADIGAGPMPFTLALAEEMRSRGRGDELLYMEDVNAGFLPLWSHLMNETGLQPGQPIIPVIGTEDDVTGITSPDGNIIPPNSVDVVLLTNVWYYVVSQGSGSVICPKGGLTDDQIRLGAGEFFASIDKILRPGGRVVITAHHWPNYPPEAVVDQISRVLGHTEYRQLAITRLGGMDNNTAVILQNGDAPTLRMPLR